VEFQRCWWTKLTADRSAPLPCSINMRVIPRLQARKMLPLYGQRPQRSSMQRILPRSTQKQTLYRLRNLPHHYDFSPRLHPACTENVTAAYNSNEFSPRSRRLFPQCSIGWPPNCVREGTIDHIISRGPSRGKRTLQPLPYSGTSTRDFAAPDLVIID